MKAAQVILCSLIIFPILGWSNEPEVPFNYPAWWLVGGELGLQEKSGVTAPEINNSGYELALKFGYTRYKKSWVWDVGLGYRYDLMEQEDVSVETLAFMGEAGLRYRLSKRWSLGGELQILMGEDVSFSDVGTNSDDLPTAMFIGPRLLYDIPSKTKERMWRLGGQILTDIDLDNRSVTFFEFVAEYTWPSGKQIEQPVKKKKPPKKKRKKRKKKKPVVLAPKPELKLNLKEAGVRFASGSSTLVGESKTIIERLAKVLKKYDGEWNFIKVSGHTDKVGNYRNNIKLSLRRADEVRSVFVSYGISETKISAQGFGPDQLLAMGNTAEDHAKNRRVELNIVSERASPEFADELNAVLKKEWAN